jgi:uncharacterized membrane protein
MEWYIRGMDLVHFISLLFICFAIYSFLGWILEVIYRSVQHRMFFNAGFLHGPFVPIYGVGALSLLLLNSYMGNINVLVQFVMYYVALSVMEYGVSLFVERMLHIKLWDYSDEKWNIHGRISLGFSLVWGALGVVFVWWIHPFVWHWVMKLMAPWETTIAGALFVYFVIDFLLSVPAARKLSRTLEQGLEKMRSFDVKDMEILLGNGRHLVASFGSFRSRLNEGLLKKFEHYLAGIVEENRKGLHLKDLDDVKNPEYLECVRDILQNEEFLRTKLFHHHRETIFDHALKVSYFAYKISKQWGWNYREAARAGLLHDFFLYDWRDSDDPAREQRHFHGFRHPRTALNNSRRLFPLNDIEKDIILKHMFPLTPFLPKYRESFLVVVLDKYVATHEMMVPSVHIPP